MQIYKDHDQVADQRKKSMSQQPKDNANEPIPVLGLRPSGGYQVPFTAATSNTSPRIANSVRVVTLYSTQDAFIETGTTDSIAADTTDSHFLPATIPYDISLGPEVVSENNDRFVAVIGSTSSGVLYISERD